MRWIPLANALALIGGDAMWEPFRRAAAAGDVLTRFRYTDGRSSPIRCELWSREPDLVDRNRSTFDWPAHPRDPDGAYNPAHRQYPREETIWRSIPIEVDRHSLLAVFGEPLAPAGRKPRGETCSKEIIDAFLQMVRDGQVSYDHGGLNAAARSSPQSSLAIIQSTSHS